MELIDRRRRRIIVDRRQQLPFLVLTLGETASVVLASAAFTAFVAYKLRAVVGSQPVYARELASATGGFLARAAVLAALVIGIQLPFLFRASAKLAGPAHRLAGMFREIEAGDTSQRAYFRRGDTVAGVAEAYNRLSVRLDQAQGCIATRLPFLRRAVEELRASVEAGSPIAPADAQKLEDGILAMARAWHESQQDSPPAPAPEPR